jgi:transaldolase
MQLDKIKIFYDGTSIEKYGKLPFVSGFTTNTTFMTQAHVTSYKAFYEQMKPFITGRSISLQLFSDDHETMKQQAKVIHAYGDNVYVKVPVVKSTGESNREIIQWLLEQGYKINITAIYTNEQLVSLFDLVRNREDVILSVFAGRISDTGRDPRDIVKFASALYPKAAVLWAGCKEVLSIQHAIDCGCKIITIPDTIMDRMSRIGKDLTELSVETIKVFNDAHFEI